MLGLLLRLARLLLALLLRLLALLLRRADKLLRRLLDALHHVGGRLLALFVLGAEEVGDGLEEVGGELELGADDGEDEGAEACAAVLVGGGLVVFI